MKDTKLRECLKDKAMMFIMVNRVKASVTFQSLHKKGGKEYVRI